MNRRYVRSYRKRVRLRFYGNTHHAYLSIRIQVRLATFLVDFEIKKEKPSSGLSPCQAGPRPASPGHAPPRHVK
jgi:hypothetical protein